jgi:hypothetical protein
MRTITSRYENECRKCSAPLHVGTTVVYERRVGVFCVPCAPTDTEEIRKYRQEGADRKADRLDGWAAKRERKAIAVFKHNEPHTKDWAFITQPGHIPIRARIIAQEDRQRESLAKAGDMRQRADSLRHVVVAGDAERARQKRREFLDGLIGKGSRVHDAVFGDGVVLGVFKKSYRVEFDAMSEPGQKFVCARDKSYVTPILPTFAERIADESLVPLAPEFVAWVRAVAALNAKTEDYIWLAWQVHAKENAAMGQSPTKQEFCSWRKLKDLEQQEAA